MIVIEIPFFKKIEAKYLFLDLNGTIAVDGQLVEGVAELIQELKRNLTVYLITGDALGSAGDICRELEIEMILIDKYKEIGNQKADIVGKYGYDVSISIGNGNIDAEMLKVSAIGICVIGMEGASSKCLVSADIVVSSPVDALNLILRSKRLASTLRG